MTYLEHAFNKEYSSERQRSRKQSFKEESKINAYQDRRAHWSQMLEQETDFVNPQAREKVVSKITDTPEPQSNSPDKMTGLNQQLTLLKRYFLSGIIHWSI